IVGLDRFEKRLDLGPRVMMVRNAQDDPALLKQLCDQHDPFDIMVDDSSHVPAEVVASFEALFPRLAEDGLYMVENLQTTFWPQFDDSPSKNDTTMQLVSSLARAIHHAEIRLVDPAWQPPPIAARVRSLRVLHNLLVVE